MRKLKQNWLDIFDGFRVAFDARKIILGTLGIYATVLIILGMLVVADNWWPGSKLLALDLIQRPLMGSQNLYQTMWARVTTEGIGLRATGFIAVGGILLLFFWSFFGGAIARIAAVDFARGERLRMGDGTAFAAQKFGSFFWAPIVPFIFVAFFLLCNALLGLIGRIPAVGPVLMGLGYFLACFSAFLAILLTIGATFGSMFMWPTIAMEGTDAFDAISRAFNYLFARPWKTLWCVLVSWVYGAVCFLFVAAVAAALLWLSQLTVGWGMGKTFAEIQEFLATGVNVSNKAPLFIAMVLMRVMVIIVGGLVLGYLASFKVTAMTIIYAVLRRDVDGTEMGEVFLPEPEETPEPEPAAAEAESPQPKPEGEGEKPA